MSKIEEYLDRAKDIAEEAGGVAKNFAGDVVNKTRELTAEGGRVRELAQSSKEQAAALSLGAREKVQGIMQDARTVKEIQKGIAELEALPEIEGSILYTMEVETMINELRSLTLITGDGRMDDASVVEEIKRVMEKVQPARAPEESAEAAQNEGGEQAAAETAADTAEPADAPAAPQMSEEEQAIENAKAIAYGACTRALAEIKTENK